VENYTLLGC